MTYKKRNYRGKRGYSGRPHRRTADSYHQPSPPDQNRIPYARHTLTKPDVEAVVDALLSGTLTQGRELERFESLLSKLTHSDYAIAFNSGTAAIHAALACLKLEPEDEVITSTLNFCSLTNMIKLVGAKPVLVDCDPQTLTLSVESARAAITENTKVIFTNNFGGHPSDLAALRELCDEHNLDLLEDASHGLGGKYRGHYVGNQSDLTCFSFHPSKAITTCEGGAVTTGNRAIADWLRQFRHHGIQKDARYFQTDEDYPGFYQELQFAGMNYRLSELHAALGRSQLTRLDRHIDRRRSIAQVYAQKLGNIEEIQLPYTAEWADHAYHLFTVQFTGELADKRDEIYEALKEAAIDSQFHYVPVHRMPLYANLLGRPEDFPNAEGFFKRGLSLPLFPDLSYKEIERITDVLIKLVERTIKSSQTVVPEETPAEEMAAEAVEAPVEPVSEPSDFPAEEFAPPPPPPIPVEEHPMMPPDQEDLSNLSLFEERKVSTASETKPTDDPEPEAGSDADAPADEEKEAKPKRRRTTRRPSTSRTKAKEGEEEGEERKKPTRRRAPRRTTKKVEGEEAEAKPKTTRRRRTTKKDAEAASDGPSEPKEPKE